MTSLTPLSTTPEVRRMFEASVAEIDRSNVTNLFELVTLTPEQRDAFAAMEAGMATLRRTFAGSTTTRAQADKIQDEALTLVGLVMKVWEASR